MRLARERHEHNAGGKGADNTGADRGVRRQMGGYGRLSNRKNVIGEKKGKYEGSKSDEGWDGKEGCGVGGPRKCTSSNCAGRYTTP